MIAIKNENLVVIIEKEYNDLESARRKTLLERAKASRKAVQKQSEANGLDKIPMEEIVADIKAYRHEKGIANA